MADSQAFDSLDPSLASDPSLAQRRPSAVRVQDHVYVAWENESPGPSAKTTEVLIARVELSSDGSVLMRYEPLLLPVGVPRIGDQRNPRLGNSRLFPGGALITVWEAISASLASGSSELMLDFRQSPFVMLPPAGKM